jgi:hypothetical protein
MLHRSNDRVAQLCQFNRIVSDDMPHVGRQWQGAIESLTDKKFDPDALKNFFAKPVPIPAYESQRRKSKVIHERRKAALEG